MATDKNKHNHTGQIPSDVPSKDLTNPPKKKDAKKHVSKVDFITTEKDPNLGL